MASIAACAVAFSAATLAPSASGALTHEPEPFSPLDGSGSGLTLNEPNAVAIDEATGNVFVSNAGPGRDGVAILGAEGGAPVGLVAPFSAGGITFAEGAGVGLAFDNGSASPNRGDLYAYDAQTETVKKYLRNPATERYELEPAGEMAVPGAGRYAGLAVNQDGDIYVDSSGNGSPSGAPSLWVFDSSGVERASYSFGSPLNRWAGQLAIDAAGDLFVQRNLGPIYKFPANAAGEIDPAVFTEFVGGASTGVAYDSATNHIYVVWSGGVVGEYDAASGAKVTEFGRETFSQRPEQIAVNAATGRIYVADYVADDVVAFGPATIVPTVTVGAASDVTGTKATLNGVVDPEGIEVRECFFEWGADLNGAPNYEHTAQCAALPPTNSDPDPVTAAVAGLVPNGKTYHFRLVAKNGNGAERSADATFVTADTVATEAAGEVTPGTVTLHGTVRPEGLPYTRCAFGYGPTTTAGFEAEAECDPPAAGVPVDFSAHAVSASVAGLRPNTTYKFRLSATNAEGALSGKELTFETTGPPRIVESGAGEIGQTTGILEARIDPDGLATSYHFEWGPTAAYGHRTPSFDRRIGSGGEPVAAEEDLSGLEAASTYHFRVVATNSAGTTVGPDRELLTLNAAGWPEGRAAELVSPPDMGPLATVGEIVNAFRSTLLRQVAPDGDAAVFSTAPGATGTTAGGEVIYGARRGADGWASQQLSPAALDPPNKGSSNVPSVLLYASEDLGCEVFSSNSRLTADTPARTVEEGGTDLYRRNPDGSFRLLTESVPTNLAAGRISSTLGFLVVGASPDCRRVYFQTDYEYPGVGQGGFRAGRSEELYEWDEAATPRLRHVGVVPDSSGEAEVPAEAGSEQNFIGTVSEDGSRVVFAALRHQDGAVAGGAEDGRPAVFVRLDGSRTVDVSDSQTATPDLGAYYQAADAGAGRIFFLANYGLTVDTSGGAATCIGPGLLTPGKSSGCDLYEYDLARPAGARLRDLSADGNPADTGGAAVGGVLGVSADGARVYFAAHGQLLPGEGESYGANLRDSTYNVYLSAEDGAGARRLAYVGSIGAGEASNMLVNQSSAGATENQSLLSRVTPSGQFLLFETSRELNGYDSLGAREAYLYSAASGEVTCLSCRRDGEAPLGGPENWPLDTGRPLQNRAHLPVTLSADGSRAFFESPDPLAPGAIAGGRNIYEWRQGSVYLLAAEPAFTNTWQFEYVGASANADDVFLISPQRLAPQDVDDRKDLYDLRVGGGFPAAAAPAAPCDAVLEGSCQGPPAPVPTGIAPLTPGFSGPSNPTPPRHKQRRKHRKAHRGKTHHKKGTKGKQHPHPKRDGRRTESHRGGAR